MSSDPAQILNSTIKIQNLLSKPELNSQIGQVISYNSERNRYNIQLFSNPPTSPFVSLKADNVTPATTIEKGFGKLTQMKTMLLFLKDNQSGIKAEIQKVYNEYIYQSIENAIPMQYKSMVKVEHVLIAFGLFVLYVLYKLGISKFVVVCSLIGIIVSVALPDIMSVMSNSNTNSATNSHNLMDNVKTIARNFPFRWRNTIQEQTGYQLTPKIANAILIATLLFSAKVLITPNASSRSNTSGGAKLTQTELDMMRNNNAYDNGFDMGIDVDADAGQQSWTMEEIYKLGYKDGQAMNENEEGRSLPDNHESFIFTSKSKSRYNDNFEYDYQPTTPPQPSSSSSFGSKIGFGTLLSMFALFRSMKELGCNPNSGGNFDMEYFKVNLHNMPPMKMGFMCFMLYRIVNAFLS
jgi:hypothetical protein